MNHDQHPDEDYSSYGLIRRDGDEDSDLIDVTSGRQSRPLVQRQTSTGSSKEVTFEDQIQRSRSAPARTDQRNLSAEKRTQTDKASVQHHSAPSAVDRSVAELDQVNLCSLRYYARMKERREKSVRPFAGCM